MSKLLEFLLKISLLSTTGKLLVLNAIPTIESSNLTTVTAENYAEIINENIVQVSKEKWQQINQVLSLNDLNEILGILPHEDTLALYRAPEFHGTAKLSAPERYVGNPDLTFCTPENHSVKLDLELTPGVKYFPRCVLVKRCSGCCTDTSRQCKPLHSRKVVVKVLKLTSLSVLDENAALRRRGGRRRVNRRRRIQERDTDTSQYEYFNMTVTEHTKCGCQCRIIETDCGSPLHVYDRNTCSCICTNRDKRDKCSNDSLRFWSEEKCDCKCREGYMSLCSSGKQFNPTTCQCERSTSLSSFDFLLRRAQNRFDARVSQILPILEE